MKNKQIIKLILCIRDLPQQPITRRRQSFWELVQDYPWDEDSVRKSFSTLDRKKVICSLAHLQGELLVFNVLLKWAGFGGIGSIPSSYPLPKLIQGKLHALSFPCREGRTCIIAGQRRE